MSEQQDADPARLRATALYTFLRDFVELRSKTVRSITQYEEVLWCADLPREEECDCIAWRRAEDGESDEAWLTVRQPRINPPPSPPSELLPWMVRDQIADSTIEIPELREETSVLVSEGPEQRFERRLVSDHPDVKSLWETFVQESWWPWAEMDRGHSQYSAFTRNFSPSTRSNGGSENSMK